MERFFDVFFSGIALLALSVFLIPIIVILRFTGEGEIFFLQERIGKGGRIFNLIKFATMLKNSMNMGTGSITLQNDFRVTKVGRILRKTKLNELPQIFNILIGDISLVGPRPLVINDFNAYPKNIQDVIYNVKPGLTGLGSLIFRDEEKIISENSDQKDPHKYYKKHIAPYKGNLELYYQKNKSLLFDIKIIILTAWVIIFPNSRLYEKWFLNLPKKNF